jgi:hypothetical protein
MEGEMQIKKHLIELKFKTYFVLVEKIWTSEIKISQLTP